MITESPILFYNVREDTPFVKQILDLLGQRIVEIVWNNEIAFGRPQQLFEHGPRFCGFHQIDRRSCIDGSLILLVGSLRTLNGTSYGWLGHASMLAGGFRHAYRRKW